MTEPSRDEARDLGSPVSFGLYQRSSFDVDYSPRAVSVDDVHFTEVVDADVDPKVNDSSVQTSADNFSDLTPGPEDLSAPVEKGPPQLPLESDSLSPSPDSPNETSPGDVKPPVAPPPLPPALTPSSPSAAKSS
jgi:hypothetical protein